MKILLAFCLLAGTTLSALADEQMRAVQQELKSQGFYYGEVDGQPGAETSAAIRRFQIRNGLQVTGNLTQETASSLKIGSAPSSAGREQNRRQTSEQSATSRRAPVPPPVDTRENDQEYVRQPAAPPAPEYAPEVPEAPSQPMIRPRGVGNFGQMFAQTPYQSAPFEVQQETLRRAQGLLSKMGYYRGPVDGIPGFASERALDFFQSENDLERTGRLDMDTLAEMRLLPGRRYGSRIIERSARVYDSRPPYRGIWVH